MKIDSLKSTCAEKLLYYAVVGRKLGSGNLAPLHFAVRQQNVARTFVRLQCGWANTWWDDYAAEEKEPVSCLTAFVNEYLGDGIGIWEVHEDRLWQSA